jgi:hypothetical protein
MTIRAPGSDPGAAPARRGSEEVILEADKP